MGRDMILRRAALTTIIIAGFAGSGTRAQNAPKPIQIPSVLAARFADMVGHWTLSGTASARGTTTVLKGALRCSIVAAGTALMCAGKMTVPSIEHVHIFGYDPVHKKLWVGAVNSVDGGYTMSGPFTKEGFTIRRYFKASGGKSVMGSQAFTGRIGSGKLTEVFLNTVNSKPVLTGVITWVKRK